MTAAVLHPAGNENGRRTEARTPAHPRPEVSPASDAMREDSATQSARAIVASRASERPYSVDRGDADYLPSPDVIAGEERAPLDLAQMCKAILFAPYAARAHSSREVAS